MISQATFLVNISRTHKLSHITLATLTQYNLEVCYFVLFSITPSRVARWLIHMLNCTTFGNLLLKPIFHIVYMMRCAWNTEQRKIQKLIQPTQHIDKVVHGAVMCMLYYRSRVIQEILFRKTWMRACGSVFWIFNILLVVVLR